MTLMARWTTQGVWLCVGILICGFPALAQSQQASSPASSETSPAISSQTSPSAAVQSPSEASPGSITGAIFDQSGTAVSGAQVKLTSDTPSSNREALSREDGQFSFADIAPGFFHITITSAGFATQTFSGMLHSGQNFTVPQISLAIATSLTEVRVGLTPIEIAEDQIRDEEKQRVLGFVPNFYVSYVRNAAPLSSRQKFKLAWKTTIDPVTFGLNGAIAGIQQAQNAFSGYGQGAQGYAKRYGASYADLVTGTYIGGAILPSLLKQDPRYFYKGTGSVRSRILYAIASAVICKGDNGHWQPDYSGILGSVAAGGISNLYYPASNRDGAGLTFENTFIGIGASAATNLLQEFLIRKLTPNLPSHEPDKVQSIISKFAGVPLREGD